MHCAPSIRPSNSRRTRWLELVVVVYAAGGISLACDRRAPITSCDQDLSGEYADGDRRWTVVDHGRQLDAFPGFADVPSAGGLEVAPRVLELYRAGAGPEEQLRGDVKRRYMKGALSCWSKLPVRVARCADDTLEVVHADPPPPLSFAPCQFGRAEPARVERWRRY